MTKESKKASNILKDFYGQTDKQTSRRDFLRKTSAFGMLGLSIGGLSMLSPIPAIAASLNEGTPNWDRYVVIVHLAGGNDGLNTFIPYRDEIYYQARPTLAFQPDQVLKLSDTIGLNPYMQPLMEAWEANDLAIIQNIGYPHVNRSHLRSKEIWDTASEHDIRLSESWIGQLFSRVNREALEIDSLGISMRDDGLLRSLHLRNARLDGVGDFNAEEYQKYWQISVPESHNRRDIISYIQETYKNTSTISRLFHGLKNVTIPNDLDFYGSGIGYNLLEAARVIKMGIRVPIIATSHSGFDCHNDQANEHMIGLSRLADALAAFRKAIIQMGKWDKVILMTISEFGRRVEENGTKGTDHGSAAPHFVMGGRVRGGFYGPDPDLGDLDGRGDLKFTTHFREYFATAAKWWNLPDSARAAVFGEYKPLKCIRF